MTLILLLDFNLIFQRSTPKEAPLIKYTDVFAYVCMSKSTAPRGSSPETVSPARQLQQQLSWKRSLGALTVLKRYTNV